MMIQAPVAVKFGRRPVFLAATAVLVSPFLPSNLGIVLTLLVAVLLEHLVRRFPGLGLVPLVPHLPRSVTLPWRLTQEAHSCALAGFGMAPFESLVTARYVPFSLRSNWFLLVVPEASPTCTLSTSEDFALP